MNELDDRVEYGPIPWQRNGVVEDALHTDPAVWPTTDPQWIEDRFWAWVHYTARRISRGEIFEALDALALLRRVALAPLITAGRDLRPSGVRRIERVAPDFVPALRRTVAGPTAPECWSALHATVALYDELRDIRSLAPRTAARRVALDSANNAAEDQFRSPEPA